MGWSKQISPYELCHVFVILLFTGLCGALPVLTASQVDIPGPDGSGAFGTLVTVLPNGNIIVTDPAYNDPSGAGIVGAVYLYNGATLKIISMLTGSTGQDNVGNGGVTVLSNGNFVISSPSWNNVVEPNAGAVTWGSATSGVSGVVSASNSLIGGTRNDFVGQVTALSNGGYIVVSNWTNPAGPIPNVGAVTWCNALGSTVGLITPSNSLVGGTANDRVGTAIDTRTDQNLAISILMNGNYVVLSPNWKDPAGSNSGAVQRR